MSVLQDLKPAPVWKHFEALCGIPHPSNHEEGVAAYIMEQAKALGLDAKRDEVGNVLVTKPAAAGCEAAETLILQGHMDMVPVAAPGVQHDFTKDPIKVKIEDDHVRAVGTTLGADNGIGVAIMLAVMEDNFAHGELEFLFTINEEAGMTGAHELKPEFVKGRSLLNLDTEDWGEYYISCAGGGDSVIHLPVTRGQDEQTQTVKVHVGGLKGGHSGVDIHLGRGSGVRILGRVLAAAYDAAPFRLIKLAGGNKRNSIADGGHAFVRLSADKLEAFKQSVAQIADEIRGQYSQTDPGFSVKVTEEAAEEKWEPMTADDTRKVLALLIALPHGILAMSPAVPGLVETSTNQGVLETQDGEVQLTMLTRSAVNPALDLTKQRIKTIAGLVGANVDEPRGYPGWKPNMDSRLLQVGKQVYQKLYGEEPAVKAVHAGLECGLFGQKLPGADMLSIGPTVRNAHSPDEELHIPTVPKCYELLVAFLKALAAPKA